MTLKKKTAFFATLLCSAALFVGCGKSDGLVSISGTVTVDGAPATAGSINFMPENGAGTPVGARIGSDGKYEARVTPGKLGVTVRVQQEIELEDATEEEKARGITTTIVDVEFVQKPGDDVLSIDAQSGGTYDFPLTTE